MEEKKIPLEWCEIFGIVIRDPDGWRSINAPSWDTPIDSDEWQRRMGISTIEIKDSEKFFQAQLDYAYGD